MAETDWRMGLVHGLVALLALLVVAIWYCLHAWGEVARQRDFTSRLGISRSGRCASPSRWAEA